MYLTENWRLKDQRYTLKGTRNTETQEITFPPRVVAAREIEHYDFVEKDDAQPEEQAENIPVLAEAI